MVLIAITRPFEQVSNVIAVGKMLAYVATLVYFVLFKKCSCNVRVISIVMAIMKSIPWYT